MRPPVHRVISNGADASKGRAVLAPAKAIWNAGLFASAIVLAPLTFSLDALLVFLVTTYSTLLLGHSVGMHRCVIHRSFDCAKWLERVLVYLGGRRRSRWTRSSVAIVGIGGWNARGYCNSCRSPPRCS